MPTGLAQTYGSEKKQDAAHEPERSHVKQFCETNYSNSLVHVSPGAVPVHCRLWNVEGGGMQSVEREESEVLSVDVACRV